MWRQLWHSGGKPDEVMYGIMIEACAKDKETERANRAALELTFEKERNALTATTSNLIPPWGSHSPCPPSSTSQFWWQDFSSSRSGPSAFFPALWSTPLPVLIDFMELLPSRTQ